MQYICTNLTLNVPIVKHTVEPSRYVVHCGRPRGSRAGLRSIELDRQ